MNYLFNLRPRLGGQSQSQIASQRINPNLTYAMMLPITALFLLYALLFNSNPLYAAVVPQSAENNPVLTKALTEILGVVDLPTDCTLENTGEVDDFLIGAAHFSGSYSVWRNCDEDAAYLGLLLAKPVTGSGMILMLRTELDAEDDLSAFQQVLSEQFQQTVIWGPVSDAPTPDAPTPDAPTSANTEEVDATSSDSGDSSVAQAPTRTPRLTQTPTQTPTQQTQTATPASTATSAPTATPTTASLSTTVQLATVQVEALNLRDGPGTNYPRVGTVSRGDVLAIVGQVNRCTWIQIRTPVGATAWISGAAQFVAIQGDCATLPTVQPPAPPTPIPTAASRSGSGGIPFGAPSGADPNKGCYLLENFLGVELTFTMTRTTDGRSRTFKVPPRGEQIECIDPGPYTYTIDAPPPWNSLNGKLDAAPGDALRWSIGGE